MPSIVLCARCNKPIFSCVAVNTCYAGERSLPEDFVPLGDYAAPKADEEMLCPLCGELFVYPIGSGQVVLKLEGGMWWPHPPFKVV